MVLEWGRSKGEEKASMKTSNLLILLTAYAALMSLLPLIPQIVATWRRKFSDLVLPFARKFDERKRPDHGDRALSENNCVQHSQCIPDHQIPSELPELLAATVPSSGAAGALSE